MALPSRTSHIRKPLDISVFGPFKSYFEECYNSASRVLHEENVKMDKFTAAKILTESYEKSMMGSNKDPDI